MIKRAAHVLAGALAALLLVAVFAAPGQPWVGPQRAFLPVAFGQPGVPKTALIHEGQIGNATAWVDADGTVMVTFLSHDQGGRVLVGVDNGTTFTLLPDAPIPLGVSPSFEAPGLKNAPGMAVKAFGKKVLYVPLRSEADGRYNLWRVVW